MVLQNSFVSSEAPKPGAECLSGPGKKIVPRSILAVVIIRPWTDRMWRTMPDRLVEALPTR